MQNPQFRREKAPHSKSLPKGGTREMMAQRLMTAQIRVRDLDVDEILPQPVAEFGGGSSPNLRQPVGVSEQS